MNRQPAEWISIKVKRGTYELAVRVMAAQRQELEDAGLTGSVNAIVLQALKAFAAERYPEALYSAKTS